MQATRNSGTGLVDAFVHPNGDLMAAIGDVAGHDVEAAALMGQLRKPDTRSLDQLCDALPNDADRREDDIALLAIRCC